MELRKLLFPSVLVLAGGGFVVFSLSRAQDRSGTPDSAPLTRASSPTAASLVAPERVHRDISKLPRLQQQMYLTAQRGADWLCRANQSDGRCQGD